MLDLFEPDGFKSEKINEQPKHFKTESAKKFIDKCVEVCVSEYKEIMVGNHAIDAYEYYWSTLN